MSKKIQLRIAEPCHENWDNMTPVQQGKFCGSCQKQVVDFTGMSDRQIAEFFKQPSTGSVCGRFMNDQLERDIEIPKKRLPWVKYFFTIALPAFFLSKASAQKMGKPVLRPAKDTVVQPLETDRITLGMVAPDRIVPQENDKVIINNSNSLQVWITDAATGLPVSFATVILNTSIGKENLQADGEGKALLNIYRKLTFHGITISAPGYTSRTVSYGEFKKGTDGRIVFKLDKEAAVKEEEIIKGKVMEVPVCNVRMGAVAYVPVDLKPVYEITISGKVVDENNNPVPFASIAGSKKGEGIMADEDGRFTIKKDWLKNGRSIEVSSAGYKNAVVKAGEEVYQEAELVVKLSQQEMLKEVILPSYETIRCTRTTGLVSVVQGYAITNEKTVDKSTTETNTFMNEPQLQVYPNPAPAGSTIHLGFKNTEEDYYQLQIISASGQLVKQQEIWLDAEARLLNIELPSVTAGTYFIILASRKNGKKYSQKIIIQ